MSGRSCLRGIVAVTSGTPGENEDKKDESRDTGELLCTSSSQNACGRLVHENYQLRTWRIVEVARRAPRDRDARLFVTFAGATHVVIACLTTPRCFPFPCCIHLCCRLRSRVECR